MTERHKTVLLAVLLVAGGVGILSGLWLIAMAASLGTEPGAREAWADRTGLVGLIVCAVSSIEIVVVLAIMVRRMWRRQLAREQRP